MRNVTIDVKHITRVEGHGNISVRVSDGQVTHLELAIVESPRYFESFLRGRHYDEAPHITCRICGICSVGHTTAAIKGIEAACGIVPSPQTVLLRRMLLYGEIIQSHVLHLYFLAAPDYLGVGSVIPLARTHPDVVRRALRMKRLANEICRVFGGRHIHPIAMRVGGFTHLPSPAEMRDLREQLVAAREDLAQTVELFAALKFPSLQRPTEFVALRQPVGGYDFYDGDIVSTLDPHPTPAADYRTRVVEEVVPHSAAKHCRSPHSPTYAVGALARFNLNHDRLLPAAQSAAARLGLTAPSDRPFDNNAAQLVEVVESVEASIALLDRMLADGLRPEPLVQPLRPGGRGVGAVEVPRGLLFHEYEVDRDGRIVGCNLIIPTGQNLANIEEDMRAMLPRLLSAQLGREEMTLQLEMLVRAYDPCISCATHFLELELV